MSKKSSNPPHQPLSQRHLLGIVAVVAYLGYLTSVHRLLLGPLVHLVLPQIFISALSWYIASNLTQRTWLKIGIAVVSSCLIALIGVSPHLIRWLTYPPTVTERIIEKRTTFAPADITTRYGISEAKRLFLVGQSDHEAYQRQQRLSFSPFASTLTIESNTGCMCSYLDLVPSQWGPTYQLHQAGPDVTDSRKGDVAVLPFPHIQTQFTTHPTLPVQTITMAVFNGVDRTARLTLRVPSDVCSSTLHTTTRPATGSDANTAAMTSFSDLTGKTCHFFSNNLWTFAFQQIWQRTHFADEYKPEVLVDQFLSEAIALSEETRTSAMIGFLSLTLETKFDCHETNRSY